MEYSKFSEAGNSGLAALLFLNGTMGSVGPKSGSVGRAVEFATVEFVDDGRAVEFSTVEFVDDGRAVEFSTVEFVDDGRAVEFSDVLLLVTGGFRVVTVMGELLEAFVAFGCGVVGGALVVVLGLATTTAESSASEAR